MERISHFDSGIYEFNKIVLGWNVKYDVLNAFKQLKVLPAGYILENPNDVNHYNKQATNDLLINAYYKAFKPHILEEARAILAKGIEAVDDKRLTAFRLDIKEIKLSKNEENPSTIIVSGQLPLDTEIHSGVALLLEIGNLEILALVSEDEPHADLLRLKLIVDEELEDHKYFEEGKYCKGYVLGSLITQQRMYEVCTMKPIVPFLPALVAGKLPMWPLCKDYAAAKTKWPGPSTAAGTDYINLSKRQAFFPSLPSFDSFNLLNLIQVKVARKFLNAENGLYLLQGPPGTGKTTTIVAMLKALVDSKKRIMLCAPSNKAVHVIAERFLQHYPEVPVSLAAIENKLPDNLQNILVHKWNFNIINEIKSYKEKLLNRIDLDNILNLELKNLEIFQQNALKRLTHICRSPLVAITNLIGERTPYCYRLIYKNVIDFISKIDTYKQEIKTFLQSCDNKTIESLRSFRVHQKQKKISNQNMPNILVITDRLRKEIKNILDEIITILIKSDLELELLNSARIIFCTLSVAGRSIMKQANPVDVLFVDEAGQAVEAEILIPFALKPKKCLLVGDVKQLPATVISPYARSNRFERSMMARLILTCQQPYELLTEQYSMAPPIRMWPAKKYYDDALIDAEIIQTRQPPYAEIKNAMLASYSFINIESRESKDGFSYKNYDEARVIVNILKFLKLKSNVNVEKHVGIITFYASQVQLIKQSVKTNNLGEVKIHTVDGFQGDESDIIIISFVRSNKKEQIGFLDDHRRLNVAITRAKHALIMLGNYQTLMRSETDLAKLVNDVKKRNCLWELADIESLIDNQTVEQKVTFKFQ